MDKSNEINHTYVLGHAPKEIQRLLKQARLLNPFTRRLLEEIGITKGMKVLDVGCGVGDVSLLTAELVGAEGCVVGVDTSATVLQLARTRAQAASLDQITFLVGDILDLTLDQKFDAIVGRLILLHLREPATFLRSLTKHLRSGGLLAFQEYNLSARNNATLAPSLLLEQMGTWIAQALQQAGVDVRMGIKLYDLFLEAGLPTPQLHYETTVGTGPEWTGYEVMLETVCELTPLILKYGLTTKEELEAKSLAFREEIVSRKGLTLGPDLVSAWTHLAIS